MKAQFNLIKSANQSIKISFKILRSIPNKRNFKSFSYNKVSIFDYSISIINSQFDVVICPSIKLLSLFHKNVMGSFMHDYSIKFEASQVDVFCEDQSLLDNVISGFLQKDFIYSIYKKDSLTERFKTSYKLKKNNNQKLKSINFLKELVSEPSNIIYPESFVTRTEKQINKSKVNIKISDQKKIKQIGLNCLLAVSQGSARKPRVMEFYKKNHSKNVDILFVGKGVCFDSGGISIKPSAGMEEMKWDMGGAAVTVAIIKYLSEINTHFSYAGIVGLVENMPSGTAYKPGDIIKSYKGINVEVLNTDAEGRLVLADIITYGCEIYKPKIVIDFATLTGAIMVALGQHYAGMFSNDDDLSDALYQSGIETNEKVWRMPLHDDFDKELNSPFVDLKNIGAGRYGGSVTAAQFLQRFVPPKTKWAHLDIAGTTWKNSGDILNRKGATGFGLTLIADFIDRYFKN
ncbi:leucyl aminopeptidase [Alphaproteobacteria bacterium]|nr:leucyl aminopeptidase [Alphaproteobacteria bacterium]